MRIRFAWLIGTALAYGIAGGYLLYTHLWDVNGGLAWTPTAFARLGWAAFVFLASTLWLACRHPTERTGWLALHAAGAFLLGAAAAWGMVEYLMLGSQHPWDTDLPENLRYCSCARRIPIIRQTLLAALSGTIVAAVLAPLIARVVNRARPLAVEPHV